MTFKIDFTRPHLYEDVVTLNQGNLSTNNTLRCRVVTGGSDDVTGADIVCTFSVNGKQIFESGKVVDGPRGIVDVVFPSEALVVGENTLEFLVNRVDGSVAQSPVIKYRVWQGITTDDGVRADSNYPLLVELINQVNSAVGAAGEALEGANSVIVQGEELKASVDKLKVDCIASVDAFTKESSNKVDAAIAKCEASVVKADSAAEKAILAANNSDAKTAENIKNVNAAIAAGTKDLEVKAARTDMDGKEHGSLKERLESDLKKGKVIEETKEGTYLSFNDTVRGIVSDIEVLGNTVQDASNLANIRSSCIPNGDGTFKMSILSIGENIFNGKFELGSLNGVTGQNLDSSTNCRSDFIKVSNKQISWLLENSSGGYIFTYDKDKNFISSRINAGTYRNYTLEDNTAYIRVRLQDANVNTKMTIVYGILELTNHIPYEETRCDIKLPCQLEKWDRLHYDKDENAWVVDKGITKIMLGDIVPSIQSSQNGETTYYFGFDLMDKAYARDVFCNVLPFNTNTFTVGESESVCVNGGLNALMGRVKSDKVGAYTKEAIQSYLKKVGAYALVSTVNPQKIVLPQSEQIKLNSFANKTHIYTISGDVDAIVKATVNKSLASTVQANTNEINILNGKIEDIQGLKESQDFAYETNKGYLVCKDTQNGVVKDLKICGKSLVNRFVYASNGDDTETVKQIICKDYKNLNSGKFTIPNISNKPLRFNIYNKSNDSYIRTQTINPNSSVVVDLDSENAYLYDINGAVSDGWTSCDELKAIAMFIQGEHVNLTLNSHFEGIASVGNGNEIEVLSVKSDGNLFDGNLEIGSISNSNGTDSEVNNRVRTSYINLTSLQSFKFECDNEGVQHLNTHFYDYNKKWISSSGTNSQMPATFNVPFNAKYCRIVLKKNSDTEIKSLNDFNRIVIYKDIKPNYEHKQDKKTILFKDADNTWKPILNLRGIDENNCDIVDSDMCKYYENVIEKKLNGSENWIFYQQTLQDYLCFYINLPDVKLKTNLICDKFQNVPTIYLENFVQEGIGIHPSLKRVYLKILKNKLESVDVQGFKTWLQNNNVSIEYLTDNPKEYEINPLFPNSYDNETMISICSGVIAPRASWKITSSLPNTINTILNRQSIIENEVFNTFTTMFKSMLNGNLDQVAYMLYPECFDRDPDEGIMTIPEIMKSFK